MIVKRYARATAAVILGFVAALFITAQTARPEFNRAQTYDVQHYTIRVSFDRAAKKVTGDTTVQVKPLKGGFTQLELDAAGLIFESVKLDPAGIDLQHKTAGEKVIVTLDKAYSPDEAISVRFKYIATPKKGIYFVDEQTENGQQVHSAQIWTQGEAEEAHHWFPSFDFPSDKATTEQFITAQKGETVIGNGELVAQTENPDGSVTFHYKMPVPHSTYLVSFVIGKYTTVSEQYRQIPIRFFVYPGKESIVPQAYGRTRDMMRAFEEVTGVDYPFNKYDQTMVSSFQFGGMENITATTMADSEIFFANFEFGKSAVEDLVSHELAHSWFGNLVTCKNWAELWLNEGFATFMEAVSREKLHGRDVYMRKVRFDAEQVIIDDAANRGKFGLFNQTASNVEGLFLRPAITYSKGGAVIHTLRETVGDEAFWKAINIYLNRHKFASVETSDLQKAMEEASGKKLDWFFDQWVYGVGIPKLDVKQTYNPRTKMLRLTVTQTQPVAKDSTPAYRLPMNVEIKSASGVKSEKIEVTKRSQLFSFKTASKPIGLEFDKEDKIPLKTVKIHPLPAR